MGKQIAGLYIDVKRRGICF